MKLDDGGEHDSRKWMTTLGHKTSDKKKLGVTFSGVGRCITSTAAENLYHCPNQTLTELNAQYDDTFHS